METKEAFQITRMLDNVDAAVFVVVITLYTRCCPGKMVEPGKSADSYPFFCMSALLSKSHADIHPKTGYSCSCS